MPKAVRRRDTTRNRPTPIATARISTILGMEGICSANTVRSGSAMVMITPSAKQMITGKSNLRDLLICTPIPSPIGCIDIPAPKVNRLIPKIKRIDPNKNNTNTPLLTGAMVMLRSKTIAVIGKTEDRDSAIFSLN